MEIQVAYCENCDFNRPLTYCETCKLDLCDECQMKGAHAIHDLNVLYELEHPIQAFFRSAKWSLAFSMGTILLLMLTIVIVRLVR